MYEKLIFYLTVAFAAVFVLIVLTNMLAQLAKKLVDRNSFPAQAVAFVIAELLTYIAVAVAISILGVVAPWYIWILAFIVGCMVAYGAIFGYDNLYGQLFTAIKSLLGGIFKKEEGS